MKLAIGCDHRGFVGKQELLPQLKSLDYPLEDFGCDSNLGVDYPDIAYPVAMAVASARCDLGILIDCIGIGMNMVANKIPGVRAATVQDELTARSAREYYHCNIIVIGADLIGERDLRKIVEAFLFSPIADGHHARRVEKLRLIEESLAQPHPVNHKPQHKYAFGGQ